jgi:Carbamoylphosphate synthase small subunit
MIEKIKVKLTLEDGTVYSGRSFGAPVPAAGEVVFNTAMTGYPESLTDPSYRGQILCLTYPLVGNYGAPGESEENDLYRFYESSSIHISGLIVSDYSFEYSHWNATESLDEWLKRNNVPGIYGIDTRALTKRIRKKEPCLARLNPREQKPIFMTQIK